MSFMVALTGMSLSKIRQNSTFVLRPNKVNWRHVHVTLDILSYSIDAVVCSIVNTCFLLEIPDLFSEDIPT